jgi:hypothetical protein
VPAAAVATIIITLVLVAALAVYLIRVVLILRRAIDTLGKILFGVSAIAHRLEPVNPLVAEINGDLDAVAGALEGIVEKVTSRQPAGSAP